jgi:hypothetical protein
MALVTSQKIATLYERFKAIDVTFTKEIIQVTGLITNQIFVKCVGDFWPCVIFSASLGGAKIVANTKTAIMKKIEMANNVVSLRFSFKNPETGNPVTFFVNCKLAQVTPYGGSEDTVILSLQFTHRPPDDLIEIIGRILEANINSAKRKEERIIINPDSIRRLNLASKDCMVFIQGVPRHCILRDLSFSSAKVIMVGVEKFLVNKEVTLRIDFEDPRESQLLKGKFIRAEPVEGRKELVALAMLADENSIPMGYKIRINDFISQVRADTRGLEENTSPVTRESFSRPSEDVARPANTQVKAPAPVPSAPAPTPQKPKPPEPEISDDFDLIVPVKH